ncbi:MAG: glycosyltransferase [Gemmataceae bacterium]|nr:glycosyltransferase [Gemmataceae bacterium]
MTGPTRTRVVHVSLGLDVGGQERLLVEFARHADREKFDLTFVSLTSRGIIADAIDEARWPVLALGERPGFSVGRFFRVGRLLRSLEADILHTHDDGPLVYGSLGGRLGRVGRHVHTHHHGLLPNVSRRQQRLAGWAARLTYAFVCVSEDSARQMTAGGVPVRKIRTLHNGIDLDRFSFQGSNPAGPVVTVARLSPEKAIENLLRAAAIVVASDRSFRLEIAGDGQCREDLHRLTRELKLEDHVTFLGEIRDVPALLARASLFVLPSRTEGISLTLLEAMARGLPVVTTRVGGNPEVVDDGKTGFLVPSQDPAELAVAILRMRADPAESQAMGRLGRHRVETHFDVRRMIRDYEELYLEGALPLRGIEPALAQQTA